MIRAVKVKLGKPGSLAGATINLNRLNVIVGPNNSGKSLLIRELYHFFRESHIPRKILDDVEIDNAFVSHSEYVTRHKDNPREGEHLLPDHIWIHTDAGRNQIHTGQLKQLFDNPRIDPTTHRRMIVAPYVKYFDGASRLGLANDRPMGDLLLPPTNPLQRLFKDPSLLEQVRDIVYDAISLYLVIDPSNGGHLRVSLSGEKPEIKHERSLSPEALRFLSRCTPINQCSDGVKSFVGMIIEILSGACKSILIDEPEAFLHPTLAYKLGAIVSRLSQGTDKTIIVATHSPFFLMGCLQHSTKLNLFRMTYKNSESRILEVRSEDLKELIRHPLTRSVGAISGVFYDAVIVTESDNDRCFYGEINERLLTYGIGEGIPNALFLNAQNKQTIDAIVKPLRKLGICACGIYDLDHIKCGGAEFTRCLDASGVPSQLNQSITSLRASVNGFFSNRGIDMKQQGGIAALPNGERIAAESLLSQLATYGIFLVPCGELESWLKSKSINGKKTDWVMNAFDRIGTDPDHPDYLRLESGDVWDFIRSISSWVRNFSLN